VIRRVAKAALAVLFGHGVNIFGNLLLVPLFLRVWSASVYGEWLTLSSAVAYLGTLDFGLQTYAINRLTQIHRAKDLARYRELQHAAVRFYLLLGLAGTALAFLAACVLPLRELLNLRYASVWEIRVVVTLLAAQALANLPANFVSSIYQTTGDLARSEWIYQLQRAGVLVSLAIALIVKPSMIVVAVVQLIPVAICIGAVILHVKHRIPLLSFGISSARAGLVRELVAPSLLFGLIGLAQMVTLQGSTLVIAGALGSAAVALFVTSRTLANLARQFLGLLSSASWTEFTLLDAGGNRTGLRLAFHALLAVGGCGSIAIAASLWFEGPSVIVAWTRGKLVPDALVLRLLLLQVVLGVPWIAASTIPVTTNRHSSVAVSYIVASTLGVALAFAGIGHLGLAAVPAGLILGEAAASYHFVLRDACRMIGEDYGAVARRVWASLVATALMATGVAWRVHVFAAGWSPARRWLVSGLCTSLVCVASAWLLWLSMRDRRSLRQRLITRLFPDPARS
jgi:O-antigen/teichoic acid export membrane protein